MAQKLWEKSVQVNKDIERFTVGRDREMDLYLAKHDVLGSMAHITMLESIGLLTKEELEQLLAELKTIYASVERGEFIIEEGVEDVHSQVELMLVNATGPVVVPAVWVMSVRRFTVVVHGMIRFCWTSNSLPVHRFARSRKRWNNSFMC
mgnify:CR=1 FL=1